MQQISRDKTDRLQRATAEFTTSALDGYGLRSPLPARPAPYASYPVLVHRLASLLHASFRPHLTMTPLRFAITSPPSGCEGDLHPKAVKHARHTSKSRSLSAAALHLIFRSHFLAASGDAAPKAQLAPPQPGSPSTGPGRWGGGGYISFTPSTNAFSLRDRDG